MSYLTNNFNDLKFLIWDTETESLNLRYAKPWELYFQINQGHKILEKHHYLINWGDSINMSVDAARITGFDINKVKREGRDPSEILDIFDKYLYDPQYLIVGQNIINYDCLIHNLWRLLCKKPTDYSWLSRLWDTNILSKEFLMQLKRPSNIDNLVWNFRVNCVVKKGVKSGIDNMCKVLEIPINPVTRHQAEVDVQLCFEVFKKLIWKLNL